MKKNDEIRIVKLTDVMADEDQPRKMFDAGKMRNITESIKKHGIMNPLVVEVIGDKYLIVDGERRYRASKALGIKEVPAVIMSPESKVDRLVKQFHIQEQHEGWSSTEKASTVYKLSLELGISIIEISKILSIDVGTASRYVAFSNLIDKKEFEKTETPIHWASPIRQITNFAKTSYESDTGKTFTREQMKAFERGIIHRIKEGDMKRPTELSKLRDSIKKNPKSIEKFISTNISLTELFSETKAKGAYHLRNIGYTSKFFVNHGREFLKYPDAKPTDKDIQNIKAVKRTAEELLAKIEN